MVWEKEKALHIIFPFFVFSSTFFFLAFSPKPFADQVRILMIVLLRIVLKGGFRSSYVRYGC